GPCREAVHGALGVGARLGTEERTGTGGPDRHRPRARADLEVAAHDLGACADLVPHRVDAQHARPRQRDAQAVEQVTGAVVHELVGRFVADRVLVAAVAVLVGLPATRVDVLPLAGLRVEPAPRLPVVGPELLLAEGVGEPALLVVGEAERHGDNAALGGPG